MLSHVEKEKVSSGVYKRAADGRNHDGENEMGRELYIGEKVIVKECRACPSFVKMACDERQYHLHLSKPPFSMVKLTPLQLVCFQ
jgi:hypothetical protein